MRASNAPQPRSWGEVALKDLRGLEPWPSENWADGRDWRDRGGWKLGKLARLGQPEDWNLEDWECGSPDHPSAGDPGEAAGGRKEEGVFTAFPRWGAGKLGVSTLQSPLPKPCWQAFAAQDWASWPSIGRGQSEAWVVSLPTL